MKIKAFFLIITIIIGSLNFFPTVVQADDNADADERATMLLSELGVGERVFDPDWVWEHRKGNYYSREDEEDESEDAKPVMWIVAAKNHPGFPVDTVTLFAEEVIGKYWYDDKSNRWETSKVRNTFLNGTFYNSFSNDFRRGVARTSLPNTDKDGKKYTSADRVFIPSLKELGRENDNTFVIGSTFSLFEVTDVEVTDADFIWTRSPWSTNRLVIVTRPGHPLTVTPHFPVDSINVGVRPALNLRGDVVVAAEPCEVTGAYEILEVPYAPGDVDGDGVVTVTDAIMVLRHIVGLVTLEGDMLERADLDGDEDVTVQDAITILRIIVGLA